MAKIVIPSELIGLDVWSQFGKIEVREGMSLKDAKLLQKIYPQVSIIEEETKPKTSRKKKSE